MLHPEFKTDQLVYLSHCLKEREGGGEKGRKEGKTEEERRRREGG